MSAKCFFKYFALALGVQVGLIILSVWFYFVRVFLIIYWPWLWLGRELFGTGGYASHAMPGGLMLGGLLGLFVYSILAGVVICLFKARRLAP